MNDQRIRDQREPSSQPEGSEPLTTKDMAGAAARRAPIELEQSEDMRDEQRARERTAATESNVVAQTNAAAMEANAPLFEQGETEDFRSRWNNIQVQFVDEPRRSVEQADELVAHTMKRLAEMFARERERLEQGWDRGDNVSTEDLRIALQRYRSFFDRLLSV
ncbi:MAG TPA: hypothetical protein VJM12_22855 [Pyrinomonadaceae bacterium]|nr:hypothetical protein [Pyrinomonadaceae bacterium]